MNTPSEMIPYRPHYNRITKSVEGSILLERILSLWSENKGQAFYKFRAPCNHELYHEGESWIEELGFTAYQFDKAIQAIATKITTGVSRNAARDKSLVIYWTDRNRLTWYEVNEASCALAGITHTSH